MYIQAMAVIILSGEWWVVGGGWGNQEVSLEGGGGCGNSEQSRAGQVEISENAGLLLFNAVMKPVRGYGRCVMPHERNREVGSRQCHE